MVTKSEQPDSRTCSATLGSVMRPDTLTGMPTASRTGMADFANTPCGISIGCVIHQFVSYMPAETSIRLTPAASSRGASAQTSCSVMPPAGWCSSPLRR